MGPFVREQDVIQPGANKGENRGDEHDVDHPVGIDPKGLCTLEPINHCQKEPQCDEDPVPLDGDPAADRDGEDVRGDREPPSQTRKFNEMLFHRSVTSFPM